MPEVLLKDQEPELAVWQAELRQSTYDLLFGPLLTQQAAALENHGEEVVNLWQAIQHLTHWLAERWWEISQQGTRQPKQAEWFQAEQPIVCELNRPHWKEPVVLLGQTDAVLRIPSNGRWCVLDWKTGRTAPELDLLQACLYHLMLSQGNAASAGSSLAVVSFRPELSEAIFTNDQVEEAQDRLLDLVERLVRNKDAELSQVRIANAELMIERQPSAVDTLNGKTVETSVARPAVESSRSSPPGGPHANPAASASLPSGDKPFTNEAPASANQAASASRSAMNIAASPTKPSHDYLRKTAQQILSVLHEFGAPAREIREPAVGPTFIRFFVTPQRGITTKKIMSNVEQLHLRLGLKATPMMGIVDGAVAIDLPRPERQLLPFSALKPHLPLCDPLLGNAKVPVGMDLNGRWTWCDLADSESSHMLVVGTPGSGKSQWLRAALATLLSTNHTQSLDLLLIDPKRNAFNFAQHSPLLREPIVFPGNERDTSELLNELIEAMNERNRLLQSSNSADLKEHIQKTGEPTKRFVLICDEYAALLDGAAKRERQEIEHAFKQLAQMGRAPGFHLILATQQPRANIISPAIRSLLPAKIALRVSDSGESRIAIEQNGAERLFGNGDLLFKCLGTQRLQGAYLPTAEESLITNDSPLNSSELVTQ